MERRAVRYRAHLLVQTPRRQELHDFLETWMQRLWRQRLDRQVRWSLDVDPLDLF